MGDEKLAQSDIDALIAKVRGGGSNNAEPNKDSKSQFEALGITDNDIKGLEKLFKTSIEASSEVLQSVTQKDVSVESITDIKVTGRNTLSKLIEAPYIATKVDFVVGIKGHDLLLMKQDDLNTLMKYQFEMMGYDPGEADQELIMSCSNEIMNQMMGHASNKLGNELGIFIDISTPESHVIEKTEGEDHPEIPFLKEDNLSYIYTTFKLNINGKISGDLVKVLDTDFIEELRDIMHKNNYLGIEESTEPEQGTTQEESSNFIQEESSNFIQEESSNFIQGQESGQPMQEQSGNFMQDPYAYNQQPMYQQPMYQQPMYQQRYSQNIVHDDSVEVKPYALPNLTPTMNPNNVMASTNRIKSVEVELTVELGRTKMTVKDILQLDKGSIVEIQKLAGEHVDLYCNGTLIAKGEIVVIKDNFAFRVLGIVDQDYR